MARAFELRRLADVPVLEKLMAGKWSGFNAMMIDGTPERQLRHLQVQSGRRSFRTVASILIPANAPPDLFAAADDLFARLATANPWER